MGDMGNVVIRGRQKWGPRLPRVTAVMTVVLAGAVSSELATAGPVGGYVVWLIGTIVAGALVAAVRLWNADTFDARIAIGGLATVVLVGQLLTSVLGGPGDPEAGWTGAGVAVALTAILVLALVATVSFAPCQTERRRHPYAL